MGLKGKSTLSAAAIKLIAMLVGAVLFNGCASGRPAPDRPTDPVSGTGEPAGIPAFSEFIDLTRQPGATQYTWRAGADYATDLPASAIAISSGGQLDYSPEWSLEEPKGGTLAYAIYRLNPGVAAVVGMQLTWAAAPENPGHVWVGLGNFAADRWDFVQGTQSGTVYRTEWTQYVASGSREVMVLVAVVGNQTCALEGLGIQIEYEPLLGWPMYGQNPQHTCRTEAIGPEVPHTRWTFDLGITEECHSSPAVSEDGIVYVVGTSRLHALDSSDGAELWWNVAYGHSYLTPAVSGAVVTVGARDVERSSLTGTSFSSLGFNGNSVPATLSLDRLAYIPSSWSTSFVISVDPVNGVFEYISLPAGALLGAVSPLAFDSTGSMVVGSQRTFIGLTGTGSVRWKLTSQPYDAESPFNIFSSGGPCIGADDTIYMLCGYENEGALLALEPDTGEVKWISLVPGEGYALPGLLSDGRIIVLCSDDSVKAFNPADGSLSWEFSRISDVSLETHMAPAIDGNDVTYVGSMDGRLYAINPDGTEKWRYATGSAVNSSPAIGPDGTVYFAELNGILHAVGDVTGPVARMDVTPVSGPAPLVVTVDCSASTDESGIVSYDYDWDADGTYDLLGSDPVEQHTYDAGTHQPRIRVTNTSGTATVTSATVHAGPLTSEVEPNDTLEEADQWPELVIPLSNFRGTYRPAAGSDAATPDLFRFQAEAGETVVISVANTDWSGFVSILDSSGTSLFTSDLYHGPEVFEYTFEAEDQGPFYLHIRGYLFFTMDYNFGITLTPAAP